MPSPQIPQPILWTDEFSVGIAELDSQHKTLLDMLNRVNALNRGSKSQGRRTKSGTTLLDELGAYAVYHFLTEEALMTQHLGHLRETAMHIEAHRSYWSFIAPMKARLENGDDRVLAELGGYLNRWWINHILQSDKHMGRELRRLGIS